MKRKVLGLIAVGAVVAVGATLMLNQPEKQYVPRNASETASEPYGAWEYLNSRRANQITGVVDNSDVLASIQALDQMAVSNKTSALGLTWNFAGPDNLGGRTRALIIDRNNVNTLYAAGVAGGVFKSTNAGLSWVPVSNGISNMTVASLAQASNGDLYAGTGENLFAPTNGFGSATSPGMTGGGMFKSTDGGSTWTVLSATVPPSNVSNSAWSSIGDLACDPTNANRIYAATAGGFRRSDDGGLTWINPIPASLGSGITRDMDVASDGSIWVQVGDRMIYSPNGNDNSFVEVSKSFANATDLPRNSGRSLTSVSPQDNNVVYVCHINGSALGGVYRSEDKGATWVKIGAKSALFDPFCGGLFCIGGWAGMFEVNPLDKNHIFVGGLDVWEWKKSQGWRQVNGFGPFYMHPDNHRLRFNPNNANIVYAASDGGIAKSSDGGFTWGVFNKNFSTGQFYHMGFGEDRTLVGGTQDNGSFVIDGTGNTLLESKSLGGISFQLGGFHGGDGGYNLVSWLDKDVFFTSYQLGTIGRSENRGESYTSFWDQRMISSCQPWYGSGCNFSSWMIPFDLYETTNDSESADSIIFVSRTALSSLGFGGGAINFTNTLNKPQPASIFVANTFKIESGTLLVTSDASGTLSGDGTGTFDAQTGQYSVTFNSVPLAEIVVTCDVRYNAGSTLFVNSKTNGLPFKHVISANLSPNDSLKIQDPVQSVFATGINGSVWMTRGSLNFLENPVWYKVANVTGVPQSLTISADGKYIWAGTENGRVVRSSNIDKARSLATGDIEQPNSQVTYATVANFGGRNVTGIAVDPNNSDRVIVTLGNYGNSVYVYYSTNATSANPTFNPVQGNLPAFPVYCATFDKANAGTVIIGTEYGIFATDNINSPSVSWTEENNGMERVPVFTVKQYRTAKSSTPDETIQEGDIFIATHARGLFRSTTLMSTRPISVPEQEMAASKKNDQLVVFPNPASDFTQVELNLAKSSDVIIFVRDMNGRLVNQLKFNRVAAGVKEIRISTEGLANGNYFITAQIGDQVKNGRFAVVR